MFPSEPVKASRLTLTNTSAASPDAQRLQLQRMGARPAADGAPAARGHRAATRRPGRSSRSNPYNTGFADRVAFSWASEPVRSMTGDRTEFIGRNGTLARPAALTLARACRIASAPVSIRAAPCTSSVTLAPGETRAARLPARRGQLDRRGPQRCSAAAAICRPSNRRSQDVDALWERTLGAIQVQTPDDSFDLLMNGWLLYQTLSCRLWARTGFYQPGGAFGFRDQLQDVMALAFTRPDLLREHLLRRRQPAVRRRRRAALVASARRAAALRTRCSDDLLWLPYAVAALRHGDRRRRASSTSACRSSRRRRSSRRARSLRSARASQPRSASLFEHCARAIDRSLTAGAHGLPLMGSGDWNDGMNRVGHEGRGESVWLGWFLHSVLSEFAPLAARRGGRVARRRASGPRPRRLAAALELAWDGEWYRRAYFDDGTPLGSAAERRVPDRLDQPVVGRAVGRRAGRTARNARWMRCEASWSGARRSWSCCSHPAFDRGVKDPGYIKGYLPGIRENGGQYTHAAVWTIMALAKLGYGDEAVEVFHMINPINHTRDAAGAARYAAEPYVVAGDVYAHPEHMGRGGWSWYTGSAGWMYRAGLRVDSRPDASGRHVLDSPLRTCRVVTLPHRLALRRQHVSHQCRHVGPADREARRSPRLTARQSTPQPFRSSTTARFTR